MFTLGFDISMYQDANGTAYRPQLKYAKRCGMQFCFIRAGQNLGTDPDFTYNWGQAKSVGLLHGAYYYLDWRSDAVAQMVRFWELVHGTGDDGEIPLVVDYEQRDYRPSAGTMRLRLKQALEKIRTLSGRTPILYTGPSFWLEFGSADVYWSQYPLWIANYQVLNPSVPAPWNDWTFWQDTDRIPAKPYGMESEQLDGDFFKGTYNDLLTFCGLPIPPVVDENSIRKDEVIRAQAGFVNYAEHRLAELG